MTERTRLQGDRGQVAPMTVILVVAVLALAGLVIDGGRASATRREANSIAAEAARAGAGAIDRPAARMSVWRLDPDDAAHRARWELDQQGVEGTVSVNGDDVTVTVTKTHHPILLSLVGLGDRQVTGHGSAHIVGGL